MHLTDREMMIDMETTVPGRRGVPPYVESVLSTLRNLDHTARLKMLSSTRQVNDEGSEVFIAADKLLSILVRTNDGRAVHKVAKEAITIAPYLFIDGMTKALECVIGASFELSMEVEETGQFLSPWRRKIDVVITLQVVRPSLH